MAAVLLLALALRLPGTQWELPGALHAFSYHPDELPLLSAASNLNFSAGRFDPGFYNYGTLWVYLLRIPIALSSAPGGINLGLATMLARLMAACFGAGTAVVCWKAGRRVAGLPGAMVAGMVVAVAPLHVQQSQFATVDAPATFFVALCLYLTVTERLTLAALCAGLAAATKYTCGAVVVAPLFACVFAGDRKAALRAVGLCVAAAVAGFVIGCPGAILWPREFLGGFLSEASHARTGHGLVFLQTGPGWLYHLLHSLLPGLGWPLLMLSLCAVAAWIWRPSRETGPALVFVGVFYLVLSMAEVRFARYVIPLIPAFGILTGALIQRWPRLVWLSGAALVMTAVYAAQLDNAFLRPDPRTKAAEWITDHVASGSAIAVPGVPWFYSPPLSPEFGQLSAEARRQAAEAIPGYRLLIPEEDWDTGVLGKRPRYVMITSFESVDRKRLHDQRYEAFMETVRRDYHVSKTFGRALPVGFFTLGEALPHDMQYAAPQIEIYERNRTKG